MRRTIRLTILLSAREREVLEKLAEAGDSFEGDTSPGGYMRWLLHQAAAEHGMWPSALRPSSVVHVPKKAKEEVPFEG